MPTEHSGFSIIKAFLNFADLGAEWVMWVLVALSVASLALMGERWAYYRSLDDDLDKLSEELRALLRGGDRAGAAKRLEKSSSPAAVVARAGLAEADFGHKSAEEAMAGATARERLKLEKNLAFLGTVGNNAPFVGLFGTVIGIIQAFDKLRASEAASRQAARMAASGGAAAPNFDTGAVMGTLAEALVATAIGLLVAIPAVAAFNFFQRRVKGILSSTETLSHVVMASLAADEKAVPYRSPARPEPTAETKEARDASKDAKAERSSKTAVAGKD